jgi:anti-sigma B factor antagonist
MALERFATAVRVEGTRAIVTMRGELDLANAPMLDEALEDPDVVAAASVVLDLRDLGFLDSSGLRAILRAQEHASQRGQDFAVTEGSGQVQRLLTITHASEQLPIVSAADLSDTRDTPA